MTLSEYVEYLFGVATGWLGWPPSEAWRATIPEIQAALSARIKWLRMVNGEQDETVAEKVARQLRSRR